MRILKFEAPWCTKCKQVDALLESVTLPTHVERINVDDNREAAIIYGIRGIPHLIILDEHDNIKTRIGGVPTKQLLEETLGL